MACHRSRLAVRASAGPEWTGRQFTLLSTGPKATAHLVGSIVGSGLRPGDAFCLKGDENAGQSVFAREFIRAVFDEPDKEAAAPTGTLEPVTYTPPSGPEVRHLDLRSAPTPGDAGRTALVESFAPVVSLVECAERLQEWGAAPEQRLAVWMRKLPGGDAQLVTVVPHTGSWELRAGLLHASICRTGAPEGLVVLSDDMAASLTKGLPESMLLQAAGAA